MRDAPLTQIGEGANECSLRLFARVGMRGPGMDQGELRTI